MAKLSKKPMARAVLLRNVRPRLLAKNDPATDDRAQPLKNRRCDICNTDLVASIYRLHLCSFTVILGRAERDPRIQFSFCSANPILVIVVLMVGFANLASLAGE